MTKGKVSIIMAAYNASATISASIESVIDQTYGNWELIIVDDGSTDNTKACVDKFQDNRIILYSQSNRGVAAARNRALSVISGEFFCFLDSDDLLTKNSLSMRMSCFNARHDLYFVDGAVTILDIVTTKIIDTYIPSFRGMCKTQLLMLRRSCFFGPTWMIRRTLNKCYKFDELMTHGEDLDFYISVADDGLYDFTTEPIYIYHTGQTSAMSSLSGLEQGYLYMLKKWRTNKLITRTQAWQLKLKMAKIMFWSFVSTHKTVDGLRSVAKFVVA